MNNLGQSVVTDMGMDKVRLGTQDWANCRNLTAIIPFSIQFSEMLLHLILFFKYFCKLFHSVCHVLC